jgi:predicted negative regulator of RcsB-dependent stress response
VSAKDIRRRFRYVALAYVILSITLVGGIAWNQYQQHQIENIQKTILKAAQCPK